jgi:hypothetical protein
VRVISIFGAGAIALGAACQHPRQHEGPAPQPPPSPPVVVDAAPALIDAAASGSLDFRPAPWLRGARVRVTTDMSVTDAHHATARGRARAAVLIDAADPAQITVLVDDLRPDPGGATGLSCSAALAFAGPEAPAGGNAAACAIATDMLGALVALDRAARGELHAGDHADSLAAIALHLGHARPDRATAVLESFPGGDRAVFRAQADGRIAGPNGTWAELRLRGHVIVDHALTTAEGHFEGTSITRAAGAAAGEPASDDATRSIDLSFWIAPAD